MSEAAAGSSRRRLLRGPVLLVLAAGIGGGAGYVITVVSGMTLDTREYAAFAVFWSTLYLAVSALTGVQQEITRASSAKAKERTDAVARNFGVVASVSVAALTFLVFLLWAAVDSASVAWALALPFAIGVAGYVATAITAGVAYGLGLWPVAAAMVVIDGALRLVLVVAAILGGGGFNLIVWAVVLPFAITPVVAWVVFRSQLVNRFELDVGSRRLARNVLGTIVGSAAMGLLISGFPALLGFSEAGRSTVALAAILFAINLVRAPLVIVVLSLQSYLVVRFRDLARPHTLLLVLVVGVVVIGAVIGLLALRFGTIALELLNPKFILDPVVLALVVGTSGLTAALCVTGAFVLGRGRHTTFTAGWVVAAVVTTAAVFLPMPLEARANAALAIGPVSGLVVHLVGLAIERRSS